MGILLGLLTALSWGSSDFLARFATRRTGTLRATLYMQILGFLLLTAALPFLGGWGHLADGSGFRPWAWGIFGGVLNTFATLSIYRSFEIGKMAVVAPLSASYPVLTLILSIFTGERLTSARAVGIVCTLLGAVLVARGEAAANPGSDGPPQNSASDNHERTAALQRQGIAWAITAAVAMGFTFWLIGIRIVPAVGAIPSVWLIRLVSGVLTFLVILALRQPTAPLASDARWLVAGVALLDTTAYCLNNRGMQLEQVSVVSVLASLYGAVTVAYAAIFLREHASRLQWLGIVAIFAGIFFISRQ
jgi:drug/metabolite transporter (DMT)-like permease